MVKVDFNGIIATIEDVVWSCDDNQFEDFLNSMIDMIAPFGPSGADPDPNHTAAIKVIKMLGSGKVTQRDEVDYVEGRIY